jgi:hypothetical protein
MYNYGIISIIKEVEILNKSKWLIGLLTLIAAVVIAGCSSETETKEKKEPKESKTEKKVEENTDSYSSDEQKKVAELVKDNADFKQVVDAYYALPTDERSPTWDNYMSGNTVTWSGTIADLDAIGDSIVVYGSDDYNGEDWSTMSSDKTDMMPYTFIVELKDESQKNGLKQGDKVTLKASLDSRGDKELKYNWKLYEGEVVE